MAFSAPVVTHTIENADGTTASGVVKFTLTHQMTNGSKTIVPAPISAALDNSGNLSQALISNQDLGTVPTGVQWRVDFRILGADPSTYFIVVPPIVVETNGSVTLNSKTVQLSSLLAIPEMVGQSITGTDIPALTTITAVNVTLNQATISALATGTGTALTLTIGTTIDLGALLPTDQQVG